MPSDTFWSNATRTDPPVPVLTLDTPGDQQDQPTTHMPGARGGAVPQAFVDAARIVYPVFDGVNNLLPDMPPASQLNRFSEWHSAHQLEYLRNTAPGGIVALPNATDPQLYYVAVGNRVVEVKGLTLADFASLNREQQEALRPHMLNPAVGTAQRLGLTDSTVGALALVSQLATQITNAPRMDDNDKAVFQRQLDLINQRITSAVLISETAITREVTEVRKRFDRALAFIDYRPQENVRIFYNNNELNLSSRPVLNSITTEPAKIQSGFDNLMRLEREILASQERRAALGGDTTFRNPRLDVPTLIWQLQLLYEAEATATSDSGTEELDQLHKLLRDYGIMQRLVNETIGKYDASKQDERRRFLDLAAPMPLFIGSAILETRRPNGAVVHDIRTNFTSESIWAVRLSARLSPAELAVISMFSDDAPYNQGAYSQNHPIERIIGLSSRPKVQFIGGDGVLANHRAGTWNSFSTSLNDAVTQLNQGNQIRQNEIENASRRANRHFDLGNNALRKMNDMLMTIGRM